MEETVSLHERYFNTLMENMADAFSIVDADEAMPEGGTINIAVKNAILKGGKARSLPKGNYVGVTIEDHGVGIPKGHLDRIFEPCFTTKHKGSGLGLATAYSIVKNHDGNITVESKLGAGTTFHIYLPASEKPVPQEREESAEPSTPGGGRILVMDD
ncbi:MAG: hypothetical protein JSV77_06495 [Dehalococcoidales bacterium]|nr:MAG: hypothetical protein JSV77_06495 [Dehalococcoidales bacterium]